MELLTTLSNTKGSCTFALNGRWGAGKTFVLKMVELQLRDYQEGEKFAVFHYNCWEYDYYDELLIAIVSSMLDSIRTLYNKNGLPYIGVGVYETPLVGKAGRSHRKQEIAKPKEAVQGAR